MTLLHMYYNHYLIIICYVFFVYILGLQHLCSRNVSQNDGIVPAVETKICSRGLALGLNNSFWSGKLWQRQYFCSGVRPPLPSSSLSSLSPHLISLRFLSSPHKGGVWRERCKLCRRGAGRISPAANIFWRIYSSQNACRANIFHSTLA